MFGQLRLAWWREVDDDDGRAPPLGRCEAKPRELSLVLARVSHDDFRAEGGAREVVVGVPVLDASSDAKRDHVVASSVCPRNYGKAPIGVGAPREASPDK